MKLKMQLIPVLLFTIIALPLFSVCVVPLIRSGYARALPESFQLFLLNALFLYLVYAVLIFITRLTDPDRIMLTMLISLTTFQLQTANSVMLPLLQYSSGKEMDAAAGMAGLFQRYTFMFCGVALVAGIVMACVPWLLRQKWLVLLSAAANTGLAAVLCLFHGDYGTTTIADVQIGLPLLAYMFAVFAYYWQVFLSDRKTGGEFFPGRPKLAALLHFLTLAFLVASYFVSGEFGIPFFFVASCLLWIVLFSTWQKKGRIILAIAGAVLVGGAFGFYRFVYSPLGEEGQARLGLLGRFCAKMGRMFDQAPQTKTALERIRSAGLFGDVGYRRLPVGTTDFSIALNTHYMGGLWLAVLLVFFCMMAVFGTVCLQKRRSDGLQPVLPALSMICILCISLYNILGNLGLLGIIGVSCYSSGYGYSVYMLSGALFGFLAYPSGLTEKLGLSPTRKEANAYE